MNTLEILDSLFSQCVGDTCLENDVNLINYNEYARINQLKIVVYHPDICDADRLNCDCLIYLYANDFEDEGIMIFVELKSNTKVIRGIDQIASSLNKIKLKKSSFPEKYCGKLLCIILAKKISKSDAKIIRKRKVSLDSVKSKINYGIGLNHNFSDLSKYL